jgi:hypothetical protein
VEPVADQNEGGDSPDNGQNRHDGRVRKRNIAHVASRTDTNSVWVDMSATEVRGFVYTR